MFMSKRNRTVLVTVCLVAAAIGGGGILTAASAETPPPAHYSLSEFRSLDEQQREQHAVPDDVGVTVIEDPVAVAASEHALLKLGRYPEGSLASLEIRHGADQPWQLASTSASPFLIDLAPDELTVFGGETGIGVDAQSEDDHGLDYKAIAGESGSDVDAVRVVTTAGDRVDASIADGMWGVVWDAADDGPTTIEYHTSSGWQTTTDATAVVS
jgi:hypothetical protein